MTDDERRIRALPEVVDHYTRVSEELRLDVGRGRLELERTREILKRFLPRPPAWVADVGGGAGVHAFWLAELGYDVHLLDATPRLVDEARRRDAAAPRRLASIDVADARALPWRDASADAVLLLGPLYHLPDRQDRLAALREAHRVLRVGGVLVAAGISRYAGTLDGLVLNPTLAPEIVEMRHRALSDGRYSNDTGNPRWFVTAFFHRPEDLEAELVESGCADVTLLGVEGPGWLVSDFEERWKDASAREHLLRVARLLETERAMVGASAHLLAVGHRA